VRKAGLEVKTPGEAERFFFVLHTYFALLVKLLAWLAVSRHLAVKLGVPSFAELATADGETVQRRLQEMESGGIFRAYGITVLFAPEAPAFKPGEEGADLQIGDRTGPSAGGALL